MDFEDEATDLDQSSAPGESSRWASLHLELRVPDRHLPAAFRDAFLRWLTERSGLLGRAIGASDRLSVDEVPPDGDPQGMSTLRLSLSWPVGAKSAEGAAANAVARAAEPARGSASLMAADQFVFFPDPADAEAPLYRQLPDFIQAQASRTPPRVSRLRLGAAASLALARALGARVKAARSSIQKRAEGLGVAGVTLRSPLLARHPRAWGFGLLGTAAVAAGFVAGSVYLWTIGSPGSAETTAAERSGSEPAAKAARAPIVASTVVAAAPVPAARSESPVDAAAPLAVSSPPAAPSSRSTEIPDTEVTTRRVPQNAVARPNRPAVVAVRAVEGKRPSTVTTPPPVRGSLLVRSEPDGAQVSVNGVVHGRTPLVIPDLGAGTRVVRLDLPGYQRWSWAVPIVANKRTPITVKLQAEPRSSSQPE